MCLANSKRINDWKALASTQRYVGALEAKPEITVSLIISKVGGSGGGGQVWIHEKLILKLAQWLDVDFELWCDDKISELLKTGTTSIQKPMSIEELIIAQAQSMIETKRELAEVRAAQQEQAESIREIKALTKTRPDYFTVVGYASLIGVSVGLKTASSVGQRASRICKERGYHMETCPDPRFGTVNMYPSQVLKEVFALPLV